MLVLNVLIVLGLAAIVFMLGVISVVIGYGRRGGIIANLLLGLVFVSCSGAAYMMAVEAMRQFRIAS